MSWTLMYDLLKATLETLYMTTVSTALACLLGFPIGTLLFCTDKIKPHAHLYRLVSGAINVTRSIPFIILLVALIPITRFIVGTSIGTHAAIVPLTLGAIPFFARLTEHAFSRLSLGLIETGFSLGVTTWQMIRWILFPEALPAFIQAVTLTAVTLVNYSAMAGIVGGGGLGDLAIRYGYQRFNVGVMLATIVILIMIVQVLQMLGDRFSRHFNHQ